MCTAGTDITGHQLADTLWSECGVACEMADDRNVVFILTGSDPNGAISRLKRGLRRISKRRELLPLPSLSAPFPPAERVMSVRDAWFSQTGRGLCPSGHAVSARCAAALARRENYRSAHCTYP